ncbi:molybdopterin-dependent oxidoreductase [bacterium]|nr:molybdopterin-dependent oxidoreductase [bacterium]
MMTNNKGYQRKLERREFIRKAAAGTLIMAVGGGMYPLAAETVNQQLQNELRSDGKIRLPPGQRAVEGLKHMGGMPGSPSTKDFRLKVYGEVENPFTINYEELLLMGQVEQEADVHCVTGWSMLGGRWSGVQVKLLAERAVLKKNANFAIFESHHDFTANITVKEALKPNVLVTNRLNGMPFKPENGAPVRSLVPDLYFWKSAKWLTGIHFVKRDMPGFWETRGFHNVGDPWKEQRYG